MFWTHRSFWEGPLIIAAILTILFLPFSRGRLKAIYHERFPESKRERQFLGSLSFFITALVVRGITLSIHYGVGPFHDVSMKGRHIHHMVWGDFVAAVGWVLLAIGDRNWRDWVLAHCRKNYFNVVRRGGRFDFG